MSWSDNTYIYPCVFIGATSRVLCTMPLFASIQIHCIDTKFELLAKKYVARRLVYFMPRKGEGDTHYWWCLMLRGVTNISHHRARFVWGWRKGLAKHGVPSGALTTEAGQKQSKAGCIAISFIAMHDIAISDIAILDIALQDNSILGIAVSDIAIQNIVISDVGLLRQHVYRIIVSFTDLRLRMLKGDGSFDFLKIWWPFNEMKAVHTLPDTPKTPPAVLADIVRWSIKILEHSGILEGLWLSLESFMYFCFQLKTEPR